MNAGMRAGIKKPDAARFACHPNYISGPPHKEPGKVISRPLLELSIKRAYSNSGNFYRAFWKYYRSPPREYEDHAR